MPLAGDDGAAGLAALAAIRLALPGRVAVVDTASGGFQNPHRDEGSDNSADVANGARIVARFAADPGIVAAVGGLEQNVGDADAVAAERAGLPMLVLARSTRNAAAAHTAFCLCVSPPSLLAQARRLASPRFGSRLLVVLAGESQRLASEWPASFHDAVIVSPPINGTALAARARSTDAVLILADARPPILMRSAVFSATAAHGYLQQLGHRGYRIRPQGATRNDVLVLSRTTQQDRGRSSFARRFHAVAGYQPSDEAVRAYAAAEIVRSSGPTRAAVRSALRTRSFATVLGRVRFNADGYWDRVSLIASPT